MTSTEEIAALVRSVVEPRSEVLEAYVFGSRARGDAAAHSDVDVALYVSRPTVEPGLGAELAAQLMRALGTNDVDVVLLNDASPVLYHRVLRDGIRVFSRDPRATTTREGRALSRYCDYVPQLRKIAAAHAMRIARGEFGR